MATSQATIAAGAVCLVLGIGAGVLIGYFGRQEPITKEAFANAIELKVAKMLYDEVSRSKLEDNLRILTEKPHIAGSERDEKDLVKFVSESWKTSGLEVEIHPYEVLLSYPNETDSNYVAILTAEGEEILKSHPQEKILDESQNSSDVVNPFNAYSPAGDREGELVYVNYGRIGDFHFLERNLSIDVGGKICIARYGKIFRGDKVSHAEEAGCVGLILYTDPKEVTVVGKGVYPDDWYLPGTGARRGTVFLGDGDPETPYYPSIGSAWRVPEEKLFVPGIPVTPLGYDDAMQYLQRLAGPVAPGDWQGRLNFTYHIGPGFKGDHKNSVTKMHVTTRKERKTTHNVIGYIRGAVEPDRYIIYGSHRDAWVFGSIDPSSAQSITIELGRVFGNAVRKGWKPRRTIVLCSWGSEEYGLVGSTEWVEEFQKNLATRAVVYINIDTAVIGGYSFYTGGVPSLVELVYDVTKSFPNPDPKEVEAGRTSLYDTWKRRWPENPKATDSKPFIRQLGSGSDFTAFLQIPGVSILDFAFVHNLRQGFDIYPTYHTVYETFDYMKKFVDPDFVYHQALARVIAEIGRRLVEYVVLPMNLEDYATKLSELKDNLLTKYGDKMRANQIDLDLITKAVDSFKEASTDFHDRVRARNDSMGTLEIRAVNDQFIQLERAFVDGNGISGRTNFKHVIYAPSQHNRYSSTAFPGLVDSMFDIENDANQQARWEEVRRQYSIIVFHIGSAASTLRDFTPMKGASNN